MKKLFLFFAAMCCMTMMHAQYVFHPKCDPTNTTVGYTQDCWENFFTNRFYSDATYMEELNPAHLITYKKLISNPVVNNKGFTLNEGAIHYGVQFNWAAETSYSQYDTELRFVEFGVSGKDVANARIKWMKTESYPDFGKFTITVYVNGVSVYSINQGDSELEGRFVAPLSNLKTGDIVKFEVYKNGDSDFGNVFPKIVACLEYTSSDCGGEREIIHHDAVEPTYETTGKIECWEDKFFCKYYSNNANKQEIDPAQIVTYAKFKNSPVITNNGYTLKDEATYDNIRFNWVAETTYGTNDTGTRSVEFYVFGKEVGNARIRWWKNTPECRYGKFTITVYVNGESVYSINQDGNKPLGGLFAVPLSNLKTDDKVKFEVHKGNNSEQEGDAKIAACLEYTSSNGGDEREIIHHEAVEPTNETVGNIEYWEYVALGKYYSDAECTQELNPIKIATYKKFISNPIVTNNGFTLKEEATYENVPFNWAAETTYGTYDTGTRSVEFYVFGKEVGNARLKWWKGSPNWQYGKFTITIYVNGVSVYSVNQDDNKSLSGLFAEPLSDLKTGDRVKFEVYKNENSMWAGSATIAACLEYTSSNGGDREIIHHEAVEPTCETVGNIEYWEDKIYGKYYSDAECTRELNPIKIATYKKFISNPIITNTGFTLKEEPTYDDAPFNWAAETSYSQYDTELRYVEFGVSGKDVDNARIKWLKSEGHPNFGKFTITVYVNGVSVYSVKQGDSELEGLFVAPLSNLKTGDIVKFEVYKNGASSSGRPSPKIVACLEYTSSDCGGEREIIHHNAVEPTYQTTGNIEYWEDKFFGKYYSNNANKQEIDPAQIVTYAKFKNSPVITNNGFTLKEEATYDNIRFNWVAETAYNRKDTETRSVEFYVFGKEVGNARIRWWKNTPECRYGKFTITIYVNGESVYSVNQDDGKSLGGLFAVPLPDLKTGDKVKFEAHKGNNSEQEGDAKIAACLEYTSKNGGEIECLHHEAVNPTYETVGNIECWEYVALGKYYSDAECTQELNPIKIATYKKFISNPIVTNNGFTLKEEATYENVPFNWAAETTYGTYDTGTRSVEFYVFGKEVGNARLKWWKGSPNYQYGQFTITICVNGESVYSVNQNDNKSLGGLFAVPLPDLKTGDRVKFEVYKKESSWWAGAAAIAACLEYTSSNGGLNGELITATQDPDHKQNYYSTFYSGKKAYSVPEGVTAYTGVVDGNVLKLAPIEDGIIPAGKGVILRLTTDDNTDSKKQIALTATTETGTWSGTNALTGTDVEKTLGPNQYALSYSSDHGVGFYLWENKPIGAHKAYLTLPSSVKAFTFEIDEGTTTGIKNHQPSTLNPQPSLYNLYGVRVGKGYKGIVVRNGKKIYQK